MSDNNVSIIPEQYEILKKEYILLKKELDCTKQEVYGSKRNIQLLEALQNDYQNEIELLQSKIDTEKNNLEEKIIHLEEYNSNLKLKFNGKIQSLEIELAKSEEENESLKNEVDLLKNMNTSINYTDINRLNDEIFTLKNQNLKILETNEEMKLSFEQLQKQNLVLEDTILVCHNEIIMYITILTYLFQENRKEIDELQITLQYKKEELRNTNEMIEKLNEELVCLKNELEICKNQPLEKFNQGNSLFAEVDDR